MFTDTLRPDSVFPDYESPEVNRRALVMIRALVGCCHPRAGRLKSRLLACNEPQELHQLHGEVLNLLALSFGPHEAQRRLLDLLQ
jgi:hypothetical protein